MGREGESVGKVAGKVVNYIVEFHLHVVTRSSLCAGWCSDVVCGTLTISRPRARPSR